MPGQSYGLEDGSCSYKDFSESRNNRFSTPEQAAKNRIQHPSNVLHFFNAPLEVTEENFFEVGAVPQPSERALRFRLPAGLCGGPALCQAPAWVPGSRQGPRWAEEDARLSVQF